MKTEEQLSRMEGPARLLQYEQEVGITELCLDTHVFSLHSWKKVSANNFQQYNLCHNFA